MGGTLTRIHKTTHLSSKSLSGKTIIITGSNTGIGFQTALDLARRNGRIILACRNSRKGEAAKNRIIQLTGNEGVVFRPLDVSLMSSIRTFVDVIRQEEDTVDILINNAAVVSKCVHLHFIGYLNFLRRMLHYICCYVVFLLSLFFFFFVFFFFFFFFFFFWFFFCYICIFIRLIPYFSACTSLTRHNLSKCTSGVSK
jgi:hypothetical protein